MQIYIFDIIKESYWMFKFILQPIFFQRTLDIVISWWLKWGILYQQGQHNNKEHQEGIHKVLFSCHNLYLLGRQFYHTLHGSKI